MKRTIKRALALFPPLNRAVWRHLTERRVRRVRTFMQDNYLYPNELEPILGDYRYSIARNNRGVLQVLNIEEAVKAAVERNLVGAFVETGTWTGGASAYALLSILRNQPKRPWPYWGFDSFAGMPKPTALDGGYAAKWMYGKEIDELPEADISGDLTGSDVNFADYNQCLAYLRATGYPSPQIHLVKGWFQDTLPVARHDIGPIAILRMDGDFYESTKSILENLYDNVVSGGFILIDDYGGFEGCKRAVDEFLSARNIAPHIHYVDHSIRFFVKPS